MNLQETNDCESLLVNWCRFSFELPMQYTPHSNYPYPHLTVCSLKYLASRSSVLSNLIFMVRNFIEQIQHQLNFKL